MFALYVRQMCCKLELKTLNNQINRQHRFGITGNVACVPIHVFALHSDTRFFPAMFCAKSEEYFPDRLILL